MATKQRLLKSARLFHLYSGVFFAPALIFFAFTGAIQTFSLHETTRGSNYKPPAILVKMGQLHKKQTLVVPVRNPPPDAQPRQKNPPDAKPSGPEASRDSKAADAATGIDRKSVAPPAPPQKTPTKVWLMKYFFALSAWGLFLSTLSGLFMAYKYTRQSMKITLTLLAGIAIPALLLLL